jgi:D-aminopeptidase
VAAVGHLLDLGDARVALLPLVGGVGVARAGGLGENFSGDLFIAFASGNRGLPPNEIRDDTALSVPVRMLSNRWITPLFQAVVEATEEAILNALVAARTTSGRGATAYALKPERLVETLTSLGWRP